MRRRSTASGIASRYRAGRVFLLGDAAHMHSAIGGPGLNMGFRTLSTWAGSWPRPCVATPRGAAGHL
ncbi:FAD-dependent monooxygenase [Streptomyces sp. NPDC007100]|uniref:FAD-dependent monooxygenase n=1 Tax=Streptomyces sp. NPDC007100 TaxID=3155602 RepID=UPI0033F95D0D